VAQVLQVTDQAVRRLIFTGKLSATRVGVLIRVREDAIVSLLEASPCTTPDSRRDPRRRGRATDGEEQGGTEPMGPQAQVGAARA
jgi:excisionase family DNA binding protein